MADEEYLPPKRTWLQKFRHAFHGVWWGVRGQSSFYVHFVFAALVVVGGLVLRVSRLDWCLLILCVTVVLAAEMFNSALERLAKAVDRRENEHLGAALDVGSAAVLLAAIGAAVTGTLIFATRLAECCGW